MKKKIINGLLMAALVAGTTGVFVSCKDYYEDLKTELGSDIDALQAEVEKQKNEFTTQIEALVRRVETLETDDAAAKSRLQTLETQMATVLADYVTSTQLGNYAKLSDLDDFLTEADIANFVTDAALRDILKDYAKKGEGGEGGITLDALNAILANYLTADALLDYAKTDQLFDEAKLNNYVLESNFSAFETSTNEKLQEQLLKIENLQKEEGELEELLKDIISKLVTGIVIQGTYNPVFGSIATPLDTRSNFFAAYYGKTDGKGLKFPADRSTYYVNAADYLTADDIEVIGVEPLMFESGETLFNNVEGNAGVIYLTVNPTTVDFDNASGFKLVNSQGQESAFKVGTLSKSDKLLTFGWDVTRAEAVPLYEAPITLAESEIANVKVGIDLKALGSAVKNVFKERTAGSVVELAGKLYNEASGLTLPAYGVSYSWKDGWDERNVVSQYSIGATAIQPLGYNVGTVIGEAEGLIAPLFERVEKAFGNVFGEVKNAIPSIDIDESNLKFEIPAPTELIVRIPLTGENGLFPIEIEEQTLDPIIVNKDTPYQDVIVVTIPKQVIPAPAEYLEVNIANQLGTFVEDINKSLNESDFGSIFEAVKSISKITESVDNIQNRINSYIDRLHSTFNSLLSSVGTALQPVLLYANDNDGLSRLTTGVNGTRVKGTEITLVPTSYTAELLAPAYKKVVAVTAITKNGAAVDKSEVKSFNAANGLNKILDGDTKTVNISGLEAGAVYEIAYTAVDYDGKVVAKKYYLNVQ